MEHNKIDTEFQDSHNDQQKWVVDSSLDSRGEIPVRARTGAWRAALFIIGMYIKLCKDILGMRYMNIIILWFDIYVCTCSNRVQ